MISFLNHHLKKRKSKVVKNIKINNMADKVFPKGVFGFMRNEKAPSLY
jgi:hypothetical protein